MERVAKNTATSAWPRKHDHLLLHCEKTREVWMLLLSLFGVSWVFPFSIKETLLGWKGSFVGKKRKTVWQVRPLCLFWAIWKAKNKIAFEDSVLSIQRLKASFTYLLWSKTKLWIKGGPSTLIDFIDWVGSRWGRRFCVFLVVFGFNCKGVSVSILYFFGSLF